MISQTHGSVLGIPMLCGTHVGKSCLLPLLRSKGKLQVAIYEFQVFIMDATCKFLNFLLNKMTFSYLYAEIYLVI
jgi:hypothetical protein